MAEIGDPVVDGGIKYRVREVRAYGLRLAVAGPSWRHSPIVAVCDPDALAWDPRAGVWRGIVLAIPPESAASRRQASATPRRRETLP